jgi:hypothetical protein
VLGVVAKHNAELAVLSVLMESEHQRTPVSDELSNGVDFQSEIIGAKLGAKVGGTEPSAPAKTIETATN